jgi:FkbM family methyltransferase
MGNSGMTQSRTDPVPAGPVLYPGAWIRLKAKLPGRLRPILLRVERRIYDRSGLAVRLNGSWIRCAVDAAPDFSMHPDHLEDRELLARVLSGLQPGDAFLDAGSHVGLYAIGAAHRVGPRGRVIAIEPTPETVLKMRRNVALNGLTDRIDIQELAVAETEGSVPFIVAGTSMTNSIFAGKPAGRDRPGGPARQLVVRTRPLDSFFEPGRRTTVKIDVEGHELHALMGGRRLLASDARIFVELHPWAWPSDREGWHAILGLAAEHGRRPLRLSGIPLQQPEHTRIELSRA